jgi:hypothetical protein
MNMPPDVASARPVPKSLHTVTVILKLARTAMLVERPDTPEHCIAWAFRFLGYEGAPDPHGITEAALKALRAEMENDNDD